MSRKTHVWKCLTGCFVFYILIQVLSLFSTKMNHWKSRENFIIQYPSNTSVVAAGSVIKVGFWTGFFRNMEGWEEFYKSSRDAVCDFRCDFILSGSEIRKNYIDMDALVFNARDVHSYNDFPPGRHRDQLWILHNTEPPWWTFMEMHKYNGVFNLTSFLRRDSDIPTYYGKIVKKDRSDIVLDNITKERDYFEEKTTFSAWMAGNCVTQSKREDLLNELSKYIPIDTYGKCGKLECPKHTEKCAEEIKSHKFYFAFENGNCRDYVTEKFWRTLKFDLIPVVLGDPSIYRQVAPPHSYIVANQLKSPSDLARKLLLIASNRTLYNKYFDWKKSYELRNRQSYWCDLCESLHKFKGKTQIYTDLDGWFRQDSCVPYNMIDKIFLDLRRRRNKLEKYFGFR